MNILDVVGLNWNSNCRRCKRKLAYTKTKKAHIQIVQSGVLVTAEHVGLQMISYQ